MVVHLHAPTRLGERPQGAGRRPARGAAHLPRWRGRARGARPGGGTARGVPGTHVSPAGARGGLLGTSGGKETARAEVGEGMSGESTSAGLEGLILGLVSSKTKITHRG